MRVLLVSDNYLPNRDGVAASVACLAAGLCELGHEVTVLAPRAAAAVPAAGHRVHLVRSFRTGQGGYRFALVSPKALGRAIRDHRPDVVHVHTLGSLGMLAAAHCRRTKLTCVLTWHTDLMAYRKAYPVMNLAIPTMHAIGLMSGRAAEVGRALGGTARAVAAGTDLSSHHRHMLAQTLMLFDQLIVPSEKACAAISEMVPSHAPHVIPSAAARHGPLDARAVRRLQAARERIHHGDSVVTCVGRLSPEKNVGALLRTFSRHVLPAVPDARLNIIGDGGSKGAHERLVSRLGISHAVAFAGSVPPELIGPLLASSAVLAHPSLTETQGLVIAEAALAGVPSVVLDDALADVVRHGETGYIAGSTACFGATLALLLERPDIRFRLASGARRTAAEYTPVRYASRVAQVYDDAKGSSPKLA
ncbi:glycosyltransferase [Actinomadura sp. WMMA1423]|uniref:glycosyltransferase n=1 Tax=Actinomadura sp. WMMA1423 TaxID=2591108 RepID=UPI0011462094|nr:glycosyltransferase [Actinomadura sp. WMMA1423]